MKDFNERRAEFLQLAESMIAEFFSNAQNKAPFMKKWRELVLTSAFCSFGFSYKISEVGGEKEDGETHRDFAFVKNFDFTDCTRSDNPECRSGEHCVLFGEDGFGFFFYLHSDYRHVIMVLDDDIYCSKDIDKEVGSGKALLPFAEFINLLKPQKTKTVLMEQDNHSRWLEVEIDDLIVRYSSSLLPDGKWDCGHGIFQS